MEKKYSAEKYLLDKLIKISKASGEFFGFCIDNKDLIPEKLTHGIVSRLLNMQYLQSEAMLSFIEKFIEGSKEFKNKQDNIDQLKIEYKKQMDSCCKGYDAVNQQNARLN